VKRRQQDGATVAGKEECDPLCIAPEVEAQLEEAVSERSSSGHPHGYPDLGQEIDP
jgi:hypothetical protein